MKIALVLLAVFILVPIVAVAYSSGVHKLGAWIVRMLPLRVGSALSKKLYRNEYDDARSRDEITAARHSKERKEGVAHRGDLVD